MESEVMMFVIGSIVMLVVVIAVITFVVINQNNVLKLKLAMKSREVEHEQEARSLLREGEDKERRRLSAELHDGLGARLSYLKMKLEAGNANDEGFKSDLDLAIEELREISHNLNPDYLNRVGLFKAIESFVNVLNKHGKIKYNYFVGDLNHLQFSKEASVNLMRIITELLNNVHKHSEGTEAFVQISESNGQFLITVEDNGLGIAKSQSTLSSNHGIGMQTIQDRVNVFNGKIQIDSNNGTFITIDIPVANLAL